MGKPRARGERIPVGPLKKWFAGKPRGEKADFARALGVSEAIVTNWLARDSLPPGRLRAACKYIGITEDQYRAEAGIGDQPHAKAAQSDERQATIDDLVHKIDQMMDLLRDVLEKCGIGLQSATRPNIEAAPYVRKSEAKIKTRDQK